MAKLFASWVHANFSQFYLGIFPLRVFSVQVSIETLKKLFTAAL